MLCASPALTGKPDTPEDAPTLNPWFKTKITTVQAGHAHPINRHRAWRPPDAEASNQQLATSN